MQGNSPADSSIEDTLEILPAHKPVVKRVFTPPARMRPGGVSPVLKEGHGGAEMMLAAELKQHTPSAGSPRQTLGAQHRAETSSGAEIRAVPTSLGTSTGDSRRSLSDPQLRIGVHSLHQNLVSPHLRKHPLPMRAKLRMITSRMMRGGSMRHRNETLNQATPVILPMQSDGIDPVPKGLLPRFRAVEGYAG